MTRYPTLLSYPIPTVTSRRRQRQRRRLLILFTLFLILGIAAGTLLAAEKDREASRAQSQTAKGPDAMMTVLQPLNGPAFEEAFLAQMVHHHHSGIKMAELAAERAKNEELKDLAAKMVGNQKQEADQMTSWLKQWHESAPASHPMPQASEQSMETDMSTLRNTQGAEFDQAFSELMARHHQSGIEMAELAAERAPHAELKELAQKMSSTQKQEKEQLERLHASKQ